MSIADENSYTVKKYDHIIKKYVEVKSYAMRAMKKCAYTHVPVVENGKLIGVFSRNTIFSYIIKNQDVIIGKETLIKEFADFIPLNSTIHRFTI